MVKEARAAGEFGSILHLSCRRHRNPSQITKPEDFKLKVPTGAFSLVNLLFSHWLTSQLLFFLYFHFLCFTSSSRVVTRISCLRFSENSRHVHSAYLCCNIWKELNLFYVTCILCAFFQKWQFTKSIKQKIVL